MFDALQSRICMTFLSLQIFPTLSSRNGGERRAPTHAPMSPLERCLYVRHTSISFSNCSLRESIKSLLKEQSCIATCRESAEHQLTTQYTIMPFMPFTDSKTTAPYGTWPSEVTLDVVVGEVSLTLFLFGFILICGR